MESREILRRVVWDNRHTTRINSYIPQELHGKIMNKIENHFSGDAKINKWPYLALANLDGIRQEILTTDDDSVIGIVARSGRGKSTFGLIASRYMDKNFNPDDTIFTIDEFFKVLNIIALNYKKAFKEGKGNPYAGKVILLDEGVYMFFSGDAITKEGKDAQKLFSIVRALNVIFVVCITKWQKISKGVKEDRFKCLFYIPNRGCLFFFSEKRIRQISVDNGYLKLPKPNFYDTYGAIEHSCEFWKKYQNKKISFLAQATGVQD